MNGDTLRKALPKTIPVFIGYLFLGIGFGILLKETGYGFFEAFLMSFFIYAGSMQFAAISLLKAGASLGTFALTTLFVNGRHFFYGLAMADRCKEKGWKKALLVHELTDETFALVSSEEDMTSEERLAVSLLDHSYWVLGSLLGVALGTAFPIPSEGVEFVMTAFFVSVFTDQWLTRKDHIPALCGLFTAIVCRFLFGSGISLIPTMLVLTAILLFYSGRKKA